MNTTISNSNLAGLWNTFNRELYLFILSKVKDGDIAKDILQDSFIKIHKNLVHLKNEKSIKFWIYRIVNNSIIDHFRNNKPGYEFSDKDVITEADNEMTSCLSSCILPFIEKLPSKYKEALKLTEFENYSQHQLAEHLGISYSGAKSRVQRAREKLKEIFEECCNISADPYGNILEYTSRHSNECCDK